MEMKTTSLVAELILDVDDDPIPDSSGDGRYRPLSVDANDWAREPIWLSYYPSDVEVVSHGSTIAKGIRRKSVNMTRIAGGAATPLQTVKILEYLQPLRQWRVARAGRRETHRLLSTTNDFNPSNKPEPTVYHQLEWEGDDVGMQQGSDKMDLV